MNLDRIFYPRFANAIFNSIQVFTGNSSMKKKLCILHVGMPKTGSSMLQEAFSGYIEDPDILYPNLLAFNHGSVLWGMFMDNPENYHYFISKGWGKDQIDKFSLQNEDILINCFENATGETVILSGEDIFHFDIVAIKKLKVFLSSYFDRIIVVGYVRPVKSFLESAFQQLVKFHEQSDLGFDRIYHHYKCFENFDTVFGKENVLLIKYTNDNLINNDIVVDFCSRLDIKHSFATKKIANESVTSAVVSIMFCYHNYISKSIDFKTLPYEIKDQVIQSLAPIGKDKFKFSDDYIKTIVKAHSDDYQWIKDRLAEDLNEESVDKTGFSTSTDIIEHALCHFEDLKSLACSLGITTIDDLEKNSENIGRIVDKIVQVKIKHQTN